MKDLKSYIDTKFDQIELPKKPENLYDPIRYILSIGGKRLRPKLALLACEMFGGKKEDAVNPAMGIEIFHNFTLLHDDIMDKADYRRNNATVHKKWNDNIAILSGDAMNNLAYEYIIQCDTSVIKEVLSTFNTTAIEICEGQQYDMDFEDRTDVEVSEYMEMIRLKTAVLLAASLKIGALCGGASLDVSNEMYDFGVKIGLAFQLQDDLLDTFGDQKTFGKRIGGDIIENKKTYLLCTAIKKSSDSLKEELMGYVTNEYNIPEDEKIVAVTNIYNKLGIRENTEDKIEELYTEGLNLLNNIDIAEDSKTELKAYVATIMKRDN